MSPFTDALCQAEDSTMPCCISELHQALIFAAVQADCVLSLLLSVLQYVFLTPLLLIFFSSLSRLVLINILCWNSHSSRQKWNMGCWFHHMAPLCLINFMNIELTDVFRTKCCGSMPKMVQISSCIFSWLSTFWKSAEPRECLNDTQHMVLLCIDRHSPELVGYIAPPLLHWNATAHCILPT